MSEPNVTGLKAIICEDEPLTSATLATHLTELGYDVVARPCDGEEAVEAALSIKPDLILMDIKMPKINGLEAAQAIRRDLETTVVVITAYVTEEFVDSAARAGVAGYLVKPVSPDQLRVAVHLAQEGTKRLVEAREDAVAARKQLDERKLIERAKGILMENKGLTEQDAYRNMQRRSQDERRRMADLAEELIRADELIHGGDDEK
ncbi:MAG TPA: response regulator [Armatimonadota bacterium]|nr:response regulator [Armatimonadota bacterium]